MTAAVTFVKAAQEMLHYTVTQSLITDVHSSDLKTTFIDMLTAEEVHVVAEPSASLTKASQTTVSSVAGQTEDIDKIYHRRAFIDAMQSLSEQILGDEDTNDVFKRRSEYVLLRDVAICNWYQFHVYHAQRTGSNVSVYGTDEMIQSWRRWSEL